MKRLAPAVVAFAATVAVFHRALIPGRIFIARDVLRVYYPLHRYWAERVAHGGFPDWFPYDGLGQPFPGMMIAGAFHPANLLYLVLPLGAAMTVNVLACFPLAFLGVYACCRRAALEPASAALGGIVFAFGGYLVCITNNLPYLMAASTFPAALWATDRFLAAPTAAAAATAGSLLSLVLFAGDPQSFVVACGLTLVIAALRRSRRALGAGAGLLVLTALVAAVQIVPALQASVESRFGSQTLDAAQAWSVHPLRALDVALGPVFASESGDIVGAAISRDLLVTSHGNLWANSIHIGVPALVLAGIALVVYRRNAWTWAVGACTVVLALLALGKHTRLYALVFSLVPFWRAFRYPEKLFPYVAFGLALGAAAGLHAVRSDDRVRRRAAVALGAAAAVTLAFAVVERGSGVLSRFLVGAFWHGYPSREAPGHLQAAFVGHAVETGIATTVVAVLLIVVRPADVRGALVVAAVFLHLFAANAGLYEVAPAAIVHPGPFVRTIEAAEGPPRLGGARVYRLMGGYGVDYARDPELAALDERAQYALSVETALDPVTPALWGLEGANRYLPAASGRLADLGRKQHEFAVRWAPLFAARYLSVTKNDVRDLDRRALRVIGRHGALGLVLFRQQAARDRVYLARPRCVDTPEQALRTIAAWRSPPAETTVMECPAPLPEAPRDAPLGEARVVSYAPERVEVRADVRSAAVLVLNDAFYAGWTARVDGRARPILPANYAVRGVPLGPGTHTVVFSYRTPGLVLGGCLSALALLGVLALAWRG